MTASLTNSMVAIEKKTSDSKIEDNHPRELFTKHSTQGDRIRGVGEKNCENQLRTQYTHVSEVSFGKAFAYFF